MSNTLAFNITLIQPPAYNHSLALKEAAEYLHFMLIACGYKSQLSSNRILDAAHNIIFCAHLLDHDDIKLIPADSIIFNSEQLDDIDGVHFASGAYGKMLDRFYVWDYSSANLSKIRHDRKSIIPFWYCENLVRSNIERKKGSSLLFYGWITERRRMILDELQRNGINVDVVREQYEFQRDVRMFGSWAVLNLHKLDDATVFEPIRCFYPLINKIPVISEETVSDPTVDAFRDSMFFFGKESLVESIINLYNDHEAFSRLSQQQAFNFRKKSPKLDILSATERFLKFVSGSSKEALYKS